MAGGFPIPPTVTTSAATSVSGVLATLNGNMSSPGQDFISGSYVTATCTERGFMWGTSPTNITNKIVVSGTGTGAFSATFNTVLGMTTNTTFYYYAYAINDGPSTGAGSTVTFGTILAQEQFYKRYIYKVYNNGSYIGNLPYVTSEFAVSQDINTAGSQMSIICAISADTSNLPPDVLTDESGVILTDENSSTLTTEGIAPIVGLGASSTALIQSGNRVVVYEYGYYHPQGIPMFIGKIERWEATFGGDTGGDTVRILIYSDGQELDNYLVRGNPFTYTLDQSQTSQNATKTLQNSIGGGYSWDVFGQSFVVGGSGVTNIGAISVLLQGTATVTLGLYTSAGVAGGPYGTTGLLQQTTINVSNGSLSEVQFQFSSHYITTGGTSLFFALTVPSNQSITLGYQSTNAYSNGSLYESSYAGGSGGGSWFPDSSSDLYFKTFSSVGSTLATYTNQDPTSGMLIPIMNDYISQGGRITYTSSSIQATGLSLTYKFNTQTVYDAIQAIQNISPYNYYFTVDLGTNLFSFQSANSVADIKLTKGRHLNQITIITSIEYLTNSAFVTGADISGNNIYTLDTDATSAARYGVRLVRKNDSHIQDTTTAHAVGSSTVADNKDEKYQTTVTVVDKTMDITTFRVGQVVGFNGFGTFVDSILSQIVHIDYSPNSVNLTLGLLPHRTATAIDEVTRSIIASNTIANPSAPS